MESKLVGTLRRKSDADWRTLFLCSRLLGFEEYFPVRVPPPGPVHRKWAVVADRLEEIRRDLRRGSESIIRKRQIDQVLKQIIPGGRDHAAFPLI